MAWGWGLALIALTIAMHAACVMGTALLGLVTRTRWAAARTLGPGNLILILLEVIGAVGLPLAALHAAEATIWAAAYVWVGALPSFEDAMLHSVNAMTTLGTSGLTVPPEWRITGALEAADGMLLFGISTAFTFTVMQAYWSNL